MATATKPTTRTRNVLERSSNVAGHQPRVDREAGVIRGVKILGLNSTNGYRYTRQALEKARPMYEGARVNINHPHRSNPDAERSVTDWFGTLQGVRLESDGLYGDLHYLKSHPASHQLCEAAERFPRRFGLSHNARIIDKVTTEGVVVEQISRLFSVDVVLDPATTKGIFESRNPAGGGRDPMLTACLTVLENDEIPTADKLRRMKVILDAREKAAAIVEGKTSSGPQLSADAEGDAPPPKDVPLEWQGYPDGKPRQESRRRDFAAGLLGVKTASRSRKELEDFAAKLCGG